MFVCIFICHLAVVFVVVVLVTKEGLVGWLAAWSSDGLFIVNFVIAFFFGIPNLHHMKNVVSFVASRCLGFGTSDG